MFNIIKKFEDWAAAVAFAEAGEIDTALEFANLQRDKKKRFSFDDYMTAITFAESGEHDFALKILDKQYKKEKTKTDRLDIPGIKIWWGTCTIEYNTA